MARRRGKQVTGSPRTAQQVNPNAVAGGPGTRRFRPFTPYKAPPLPTGSYDPALDAQQAAAGRGLGDLIADNQTAGVRDTVDYGIGRDNIGRQQTRGMEDFASQRQAIDRAYQIQQARQGQAINAAGLGGGGASLQAAAKRAANEAVDLKPVAEGEQRLGEDTELAYGNLALGYQRNAQDRTTAETRARRENTQFGIDTAAVKGYQAGQNNYVPPARGEQGGIPTNEHVGPLGNHTQTRVVGGKKYVVRPDGSVVSSSPVSSGGQAAYGRDRRRQLAGYRKALARARRA